MYLLLQKFLAILVFPIAVVVCAAIFALSTLLWIPYIIILIIDKLLWKLLDKDIRNSVNSFEKFIFACYGFAAFVIYLPLLTFEE